MKIEILMFDDCPNSEAAEKLVRDAVGELSLDVEIDLIKVLDNDDAVAKRFLGSPSIRIDGKDIELVENEQTQYSMRCRIYQIDGKAAGVPTKELLLDKLREA